MAIGSDIVGQALKRQGADMFFYIMGGPMMHVELASMGQGVRGIDVRHEQAAAMMAFAYARLRNRPGVCMAASGPATTNLVTGWHMPGPTAHRSLRLVARAPMLRLATVYSKRSSRFRCSNLAPNGPTACMTRGVFQN